MIIHEVICRLSMRFTFSSLITTFYLTLCLASVVQGQDAADGCITCAVGDWVKGSLAPWLLENGAPLGGILKGTQEAAEEFDFVLPPEENPGDEKESSPVEPFPGIQRGTGNSEGEEIPIELTIFANPVEETKCDLNDDASRPIPNNCAVTIDRIIWPLPTACGSQVQANRIFAALTDLAPPGGVHVFPNECGTWYFAASLTQEQVQRLMSKKLGIETIVRDDSVNDYKASGERIKKRQWPSWFGRSQGDNKPKVIVETGSTENLAYISTPPSVSNVDRLYASFENAGKGVTAYWIDSELYTLNKDLARQNLVLGRLQAADFPKGKRWSEAANDHGGCMLSLATGSRYGVARHADYRAVGVKLRTSSFISGLQAIIDDLSSRLSPSLPGMAPISPASIRGYTVVGTGLTINKGDMNSQDMRDASSRGYNENKAATLVKRLIEEFQVVFVAATGDIDSSDDVTGSINTWPASLAQDPQIPILVVGAINMRDNTVYKYSVSSSVVTIHAPGDGTCMHGLSERIYHGTSVAAAITVGLALDLLSRDYIRQYLRLDKNIMQTVAPISVSAKIRNYMMKKSWTRDGGPGAGAIWNGLDPSNPDVWKP